MDKRGIPNKYRPVPFWSWNEKLDTAETARQIEMMEKAGIGEGWRVYISHAGAPDKAELAREKVLEAMPEAVCEIWPLSPAFITQGGPGCVAVQYIHE